MYLGKYEIPQENEIKETDFFGTIAKSNLIRFRTEVRQFQECALLRDPQFFQNCDHFQ